MMRRLLEPVRLDPVVLGLLALAALSVLIAGFQHARLYHRGYAEVEIVGVLFFLNAIGSTVVVLMLIFDRPWLFVLGVLSVCVPSIVSIALSHSSSGFLGFREGKLGPRLDVLDDDAEDIAESITDPRDDVEDGYPEKLMPDDYARRLSDREIRALANLVAAASGAEAREGDDDAGRGRGRNRGRGGDD